MTYDWTHGSEECGSLGRPLPRVKPEVTGTLGFVRSKAQTLVTQRRFAKPHDAIRSELGFIVSSTTRRSHLSVSNVPSPRPLLSAPDLSGCFGDSYGMLRLLSAHSTRVSARDCPGSCQSPALRRGSRWEQANSRSQVAPYGLHPTGFPTRPAPSRTMSTLDTRPKPPMV